MYLSLRVIFCRILRAESWYYINRKIGNYDFWMGTGYFPAIFSYLVSRVCCLAELTRKCFNENVSCKCCCTVDINKYLLKENSWTISWKILSKNIPNSPNNHGWTQRSSNVYHSKKKRRFLAKYIIIYFSQAFSYQSAASTGVYTKRMQKLSNMCKLKLNVIQSWCYELLIKTLYCGGNGLELLSAFLSLAVCHDSKVKRILPLSTTLALSKSIKWLLSHACFAMFDPFLCSLTFLTCSDILVFKDLPVSPM